MKGGEESKLCQRFCYQQQKYYFASTCANNNILLNFLSFVRSGVFAGVVLSYRLPGFEPRNLVEIDCLNLRARSAVFYSANGGRVSYITSADICQILWRLNLEEANIFLRVRIVLRHSSMSERFTLIFIYLWGLFLLVTQDVLRVS